MNAPVGVLRQAGVDRLGAFAQVKQGQLSIALPGRQQVCILCEGDGKKQGGALH